MENHKEAVPIEGIHIGVEQKHKKRKGVKCIGSADDETDPNTRLEGMMAKLEKTMDDLLSKKEAMVKSYAQVANPNIVNKPTKTGLTAGYQKLPPSLERQTVKMLPESKNKIKTQKG